MFKKLLFLITAAAVYLHFNPSPDLEKKYLSYSNELSNITAEFFGASMKVKASSVYDDLSKEFNSFSREEQNYIKEITLNKKAIATFQRNNCEGSFNGHRVFHPTNLKKVCKSMEDYLMRR